MKYFLICLFLSGSFFLPPKVMGQKPQVLIATAANFHTTLETIKRNYAAQLDCETIIISGSTGKLFTQIQQGAPYHMFFSADQEHVDKLITLGLAEGKTRFTYAVGQLVLWNPRATLRDDAKKIWLKGQQRFALANPKHAPYGRAAHQVILALKQEKIMQSQIVYGESVGQAFLHAVQGHVSAAFVSLAQVLQYSGQGFQDLAKEKIWMIPSYLYEPLQQDGVVLTKGKRNSNVQKWLRLMKTSEVKQLIRRSGYKVHGYGS